tara:strand:+ start:262 stop:837 length:576 start_codon:yes stop_codon:yes gene_type:complete
MNIFYLSAYPDQCAEMHCDKHVCKMIIEYAQIMSTAHRVLDGEEYYGRTKNGRRIKRWKMNSNLEDILYKASHVNHPSNQWVRASWRNYTWLYEMWECLCNEYTHRYGRKHETDRKLRDVLLEPPRNIPHERWSEPTQAMPDDVKIKGNSLIAYRNYYIKYKKDFAVWTKRTTPHWMTQNHNDTMIGCYGK